MKQFDLKEYLKDPNKKVVTRDGRNVRIICTDHDNISYPIIGAIKGCNFPFCFSEDGYVIGSKYNNANDLFFASEKHEGWVNLYNLSEGPYLGSVYSSKEVAEVMSKKCGLQHYIATIKIEWEE